MSRPVYGIAAIFRCGGLPADGHDQHSDGLSLHLRIAGRCGHGHVRATSTVSVRKWYVGHTYGTMWGIAFAGAPMSQFIMAQVVKPALSATQGRLDMALQFHIPNASALTGRELAMAMAAKLKEPATLLNPAVNEAIRALDHAWRSQMTILGVIVFIALVVAVLVAKQSPEDYGLKPFGDLPASGGAARVEYNWSTKEAFSTWAIWAGSSLLSPV